MFDPKAHLIQLPRRVKDPITGHFTTRHDEYLEVKWRLVWFREKYPHGSIITEAVLLDWEKGVAIYKATVGDGEGGMATGTGTERRKGFEDFVEKSETRSIGRALAAVSRHAPCAVVMVQPGEKRPLVQTNEVGNPLQAPIPRGPA